MNPAATRPVCPVCRGGDAAPERTLAAQALMRCRTCSMVYVWPRPGRDASRASYAEGHRGAAPAPTPDLPDPSALFALYDREHTPYLREAQRQRLVRIAAGRPIARLLDFGCGSGHLLALAQSTLHCETWGVELHPVARLGARRFGFTLHAGPLETAPFAPASFDLVYSAQVFEHLPEPRAELARLVALLVPGGRLFLEMPNYGSLSIRLGRDTFRHNSPPGHLNYFGRAALRRLLQETGLEVLELRTTGLAYRELLGLPERTAPPTPDAAAARPPVDRPPAVRRLRLHLLRGMDAIVSLPGWGVQLEAVARRPLAPGVLRLDEPRS